MTSTKRSRSSARQEFAMTASVAAPVTLRGRNRSPSKSTAEAAAAATAAAFLFDSSAIRKQKPIPRQFVWPRSEREAAVGELNEPTVDLAGLLTGDTLATEQAAMAVRTVCETHGFFNVVNHGIEPELLRSAHQTIRRFFLQPLAPKLRASKRPGCMWGYAGAHVDRFSCRLPWKETLSFGYRGDGTGQVVADFFTDVLGMDYEEAGLIYQRYCEAMQWLCLKIMELLAISLGVPRSYYRNFFEDGIGIMRCNYYPPCQDPHLTLGTGPHCDPTSLTILHQDEVEGLQVFTNNNWYSVRPKHDAFVVNIGDTFTALSNGRYRSCLHRATVNRERERISLAFFLTPREDKVVRAPEDLVARDGWRKYPDFTWAQLLEFTQKHYRADTRTLQSFTERLRSESVDSDYPLGSPESVVAGYVTRPSRVNLLAHCAAES